MADDRKKLDELIELGTSVVETVLPTEDATVVRSLLFLVRGLNAASAGRVLLDAGYEMDAKAVGRVIGESAIEYSFIACDDDLMHDRLNLFYVYAAHHQHSLAQAVAAIHQIDDDDPDLQQLAQRWQEVAPAYPNEYRWHSEHRSLRARAIEADRKASEALPEGTDQSTLRNLWELVYAESCEVAHPGPNSLVDLITIGENSASIHVGPRPVHDERTAGLLAEHERQLRLQRVGRFHWES